MRPAMSTGQLPEGLMNSYILVVDGSADRRKETRTLLERAGYRVREVISMDDAVQFARHEPPLVAVLEAPPGAESSAKFIGRVRRHPTTKDLPIVVLGCDPADRGVEEEAAAVSFLCEPCPPRSLLEEVAYLTRPRWGTGASAGAAEDTSMAPAPAVQTRRSSARAAVSLADAFGYHRLEGQDHPF